MIRTLFIATMFIFLSSQSIFALNIATDCGIGAAHDHDLVFYYEPYNEIHFEDRPGLYYASEALSLYISDSVDRTVHVTIPVAVDFAFINQAENANGDYFAQMDLNLYGSGYDLSKCVQWNDLYSCYSYNGTIDYGLNLQTNTEYCFFYDIGIDYDLSMSVIDPGDYAELSSWIYGFGDFDTSAIRIPEPPASLLVLIGFLFTLMARKLRFSRRMAI